MKKAALKREAAFLLELILQEVKPVHECILI